LDRLIEDDAFSGAVLVAKDGQPLLGQAHGLASKSCQVPNRLDTRFNVASIGKMFTGVAVAQLAERGQLSFEDPAKCLPADWLDPEIGASIQIRHLLTHTSGLDDHFGALYSQPASARSRTLDDYRPSANIVHNLVIAVGADDGWRFFPGATVVVALEKSVRFPRAGVWVG
jgi:D-alanyl-D-alanine carboxypeptidase